MIRTSFIVLYLFALDRDKYFKLINNAQFVNNFNDQANCFLNAKYVEMQVFDMDDLCK